MKLAEYLTAKDLTASAFAALIKASPSTITRILAGDRSPDLRTLEAIEMASGGKVRAQDFYKNGKRK